jgi:hypothetical protein
MDEERDGYPDDELRPDAVSAHTLLLVHVASGIVFALLGLAGTVFNFKR